MAEWISVKDRMPKSDDDGETYFLVKIKGEIRPKIGIYWDEWIVSQYGEGTPGEEFYPDNMIIHWMEIPK